MMIPPGGRRPLLTRIESMRYSGAAHNPEAAKRLLEETRRLTRRLLP